MAEYSRKSHIKEGNQQLNILKKIQNAQVLSVLVGKNYSEDQLMHIFLDNFHQGEKYSAQIDSHQTELRGEVNVYRPKLFFYYISTDLLSKSLQKLRLW